MRYLRLGLMLWLICLPRVVQAAILWVSPTGPASGSCTEGSPCQPQYAADRLGSGDTLMFTSGTYTLPPYENCRLLQTGSNVSNTTWTVQSGATVTVRGGFQFGLGGPTISNLTFDMSPANSFEINGELCANGVTLGTTVEDSRFEGFRIHHVVHGFIGTFHRTMFRRIIMEWVGRDENSPYARKRTEQCCRSVCFGGCDPNDQAQLQECFNACSHCHFFYIGGSSDCTFDQLDLSEADGSAELYGNGHVVKNSRFHHNQCGQLWHLDRGAITFYNNVIYDNGGGISLQGPGAGPGAQKIYNNTLYNNGTAITQIGGEASDTQNADYKNNILYNNGENYAWPTVPNSSNNLCNSTGTGCQLEGNPGFVSPAGGNFRIGSAGSAAINNGANLSSEFTTDADGLNRPGGNTPWTIGAYEFAATGAPSFTFTAPASVPSGTAPTLTWSAVSSQGSGLTCTPSVLSGEPDAEWTGTPSNQLIAGGSKPGATMTAARTYRMRCQDSLGTTDVDRTVNVVISCTRIVHGGGARWPIPGTIEAERFDSCSNLGPGVTGEGTTHHEGNPIPDSPYRPGEDVAIGPDAGAGNGFAVVDTQPTEWLEYLVTVATTDSYTVDISVSYGGAGAGGTFHLEVDGSNVTGALTIPNTGSYSTYATVNTTVSLTSGDHTLRVALDAFGGGTSAIGNIDRLVFTTVGGTAPVANFTGTPLSGTAPLSVTFTDASTGTITDRAWTFGDGGTSTATNPTHVYNSAGTYSVGLTVTGPGGSHLFTRTGYISVTSVTPLGTIVKHTFEEGTLTTAADSSGNPTPHPCTMNTAGWATGLIGSFGMQANGARHCSFTSTPDTRPENPGMSVWIKCPANANPSFAGDMGGAWGLWFDALGGPHAYVETNAGPARVASTTNVLTNTAHMVTWSFTRASELRLWVDASPSGFVSSTGTPVYTGTEVFRWGSTADQTDFLTGCTLDQGYLFDQPLNQAQVTQLFNESQPGSGLTMTHMRYYADQAEGIPLAALDTDLAVLIGTSLGLRFGLANVGTAIDQSFPLWCARNGGAAVKVTNSFDTLGLRIATSVPINMGDLTSDIPSPNGIPLDGLTFVPGRFVADVIDPLLTTALASGQTTQWEYRIDTGPPAAANDTFVCQPRQQDDTVFSSYANVKTLTMQGVAPPTSLHIGGSLTGGSP